MTNTLATPGDDPGFKYPLKRSDSAEDCFNKFYPYLLWLREYIHLNNWVPEDIRGEIFQLWEDYRAQETEYAKISAAKEFFSQRAHSKVKELWDVYKRLRKRVDDMGTKRVTKKANEIATRLATQLLQNERQSSTIKADLEEFW